MIIGGRCVLRCKMLFFYMQNFFFSEYYCSQAFLDQSENCNEVQLNQFHLP